MFYTVLIQVDTSMASPYKSLYIWVQHFFGYLIYGIFFWNESWRGTWYIYLLSFPDSRLYLLNGFDFDFDLFWMVWYWKPAISCPFGRWWLMYNNLPWIFDINEKFSNQGMLLTEYHPGYPSTENKFKIHMVNLSSVNHSKSWAKNIAWLFGIFTYICSSHIVYR